MFQLIKYNAFLLVPFDPSTKELVLGEIFEVLCDIAHMWEDLGAFFGIPHCKIQEIGMDESDEFERCTYLYEMEDLVPVLCEWICSRPEEATLDNLISAICTSFDGGLPRHFEERIMAVYQRGM